MSITLDGTLGITSPTYGGNTTAEYSVPVTAFKNRIINGIGRIEQRGVGTAVSGTYGPDRWQLQFGGTGITGAVASSTGFDPSGWHFFIQSQTAKASLASTDFLMCLQPIEGFNVADLQWGTSSAKTITISFIAAASVAGNYTVWIRNGTFNRSYCSLVAMSTATASYSVTIPGDTTGTWAIDNTTGLQLGFTLASGTTLTTTGNTWTAGNFVAATGQSNGAAVLNQYINLTNVQLEVGSTATSFDYRPYGTELALCQRYLPVVGLSGSDYFTGLSSATTAGYITIPYKISARVAATGITTGTVSSMTVTNGGASPIALTALIFNNSGTESGIVQFTVAAGLTLGQATLFNANAQKILFTGCEL